MRKPDQFLYDQATTLDDDASFHMQAASSSGSTANAIRSSIALAVIAATVTFLVIPDGGEFILPYASKIIILAFICIILTQIQFELSVHFGFDMARLIHALAERLRDRHFDEKDKEMLQKKENRANDLGKWTAVLDMASYCCVIASAIIFMSLIWSKYGL